MEFIAGPAALGGIILCVALCGWAVGRCQGGPVPGPALRAGTTGGHAAGEAIARVTADGAGAGPDVFDTLGALHDEISAYRRAEQVLRGLSDEGIGHVLSHAAADVTLCPQATAEVVTPERARGGPAPGAVHPSLAALSGLVRV